MDFVPFASQCHIRILVIPIGNIQQRSYDKWSKIIQTFQTIRLEDIAPNRRDEHARFMPPPLSKGFLHLEYTSHPPPIWQTPLTLFRPSEFPLGIIGIADNSSRLTDIQSQFHAEIAQLFSSHSLFPLSHNCYVFEDEKGAEGLTTPTVGSEIPPGIVVIPKIMGNKNVYVGTLIAELCFSILAEFSNVAKVVESNAGMEIINAGFFPIMAGVSESRHSGSRGDNAVRSISIRNFTLSPTNSPTNSLASKRQSGLTVPPTGRLLKFLGDLFLLAGRSSDAGVWYEKSISLLSKTPEDSIWQASAIEGLCVVQLLENWGAPNKPDQKEIWLDLSEKLSQASSLYSRVSLGPLTASSQLDATLITYLYTSCICRHVFLLFSVWNSKGWGVETFNTLLHGGIRPDINEFQRLRLSSANGITCAQISTLLAQAHGPFLLHLEPYDRIRILRFMAIIYSAIGFHRKEVYILRELLSTIMDTLITSREEILKASKSPRDETNNALKESGNMAFRTLESPQGNDSIIHLGKYICEVYGIDLTSVRLLGISSDEPVQAAKPQTPPESYPLQYGWGDLQLGVVREAVAIAEALPDHAAVAQFDLSALKILSDILSSQDQNYLYSSSTRAFLTARRRGDDRRVEYWARNPVIKIEVNPLPFARLPLKYQARQLASLTEDDTPTQRDPFIYNPRLMSSRSKSQTLVVQNEPVELLVTLKNPYAFDFELQNLSLSTAGVPFDMEPISISLPANSMQTKQIIITPVQSGALVLKGCIVQTPNGLPHEFLLPLSTPEDEAAKEIYRSKWNVEAIRIKETGLNARPWLRQQRLSTLIKTRSKVPAAPSFLECMVVPEQPLIRIRRTSLTHGAVMMYDGESSTIRLTIENVSTVLVKFLKVICTDSTMEQARQALDEGDLSVFETYETEYELIRRPVFKWDPSTEPKSIAPGKTAVLTITCTGKMNCTSGSLQLLYSSTAIDKLNPSDMCYTRQIIYPVIVTVYNSLECNNMDIIPFTSIIKPRDSRAGQINKWDDILRPEEEANDWCLFTIDVRNTYGMPFQVTFQRNQDGTSSDIETRLVSPGATSKLLIPLKRFSLPESSTEMAIPILSDRQFVVSKTSLTAQEERHQKELFWYREELFRRVKGRWKEAGGSRLGSLSLRNQRFTAHMLDVLRTDRATVKLTLFANEEKALSRSQGIATALANEFVYLRAKVKNQSNEVLIITMNISASPGEYVLFDGIMTNVPIGKVESGEERHIDFGICFVSEGSFDIRATMAIITQGGSKDSRTGEGGLRVLVAG